MDQREARKFTSSNPPVDYNAERRPSFLDRLLRRRSSSTSSDDAGMMAGMERRASMDQPEIGSLTQRVQQEMKKPPQQPVPAPIQRQVSNTPEFNIFT